MRTTTKNRANWIVGNSIPKDRNSSVAIGFAEGFGYLRAMGATISRTGSAAPGPGPTVRLNARGRAFFTVIPLVIIATIAMWVGRAPEPSFSEPLDGLVLGPETREIGVSFSRPVAPESVSATLNDQSVSIAVEGASGTVSLGPLAGGIYLLAVSVDGRLFDPSASASFEVDATAPTLTAPAFDVAASVNKPFSFEIAVDDPLAVVTVAGAEVQVADGVATVDLERPPRVPLEVVAVDPFGNEASLTLVVPINLAGAPGQEAIRGVHATGYTWATEELRQPILDAIASGIINTVQLDLKDEAGDIWYDTGVALAHELGAVTVLWDLKAVVDDLHNLNVRVVGRVVNFRDPRLAAYAVETGRMDWVVQNPDGTAFGKYGGFTNPFNREVWEYNIALAEEAALLGVDDIMYDYVRRPDENIERMIFPGQVGTPEEAIVEFLAASQVRIHAAGGRLGAAVFGIAATRPTEIGQDIPRISEVVDFVSPMVYPSHWGPGEYGVADPNSQPYEIVYASMLDFIEQTRAGGAEVIVWLQDFSLGVDYGPDEVRAQIDAAAAAGVPGFFLWDPKTTYTWAGLR